MDITLTNPWQWQDSLGYSQAVEVKNSNRTLYCAGQAAMNAEGKPCVQGMEEQLLQSFKNLIQVIENAGYSPKGIVRLNYYTTSIPDFFAAYGIVITWLQWHGIAPASTLVEVNALAFPQLLVEVEATVAG